MHWKLKAAVQNAVALLPESLSYEIYYRVQRAAGGLRRVNPTKVLTAGVATWRQLLDAGVDPRGKVFFEVGTGRMINLPIALWLMGASKTITVDLNPYLKQELVQESVRFIAGRREDVRGLFGDLLDETRFEELLAVANDGDCDLAEFLDLVGVEYHAPSDAAATGLPDDCIDFHTSYTVLEHIPHGVLMAILREARRLLKPGGLAVHGIDYSDHFSHSDPSLPAIHFLRYSQAEWDRLAGNRYMYMNRLRHHEYLAAFADSGLSVAHESPTVDPHSFELLEQGGFPVDASFADRPAHELATISAWIVARSESASGVAAA